MHFNKVLSNVHAFSYLFLFWGTSQFSIKQLLEGKSTAYIWSFLGFCVQKWQNRLAAFLQFLIQQIAWDNLTFLKS